MKRILFGDLDRGNSKEELLIKSDPMSIFEMLTGKLKKERWVATGD